MTYGDIFCIRARSGTGKEYVTEKILDTLNGVNKYDWTNITNKFAELKKKPSDYTLTDYNEYVPDPKDISPYNVLHDIDIIFAIESSKPIVFDSIGHRSK